jgi:NAD(P)H-hydrate epimerase
MKIVSSSEMREIDHITAEKYAVPSLTLMENAGSAVARFALEQYPQAHRVTVVCGKGNNGGDGFVAARKLREFGKSVSVLLLAQPGDVKGDAKQMLSLLTIPPIAISSSEELVAQADAFSETDLIVDAIFGTGFHPPLPELAARAIQLINKSPAPVISIDVPSGADSDSYEITQANACRSDAIVTFTALKPGSIFGALTRGPIIVANIGSPDQAVTSELNIDWNAPPQLSRERRPLNSNKGLYGHVLIIGGSLGKSGAPRMTSLAALRIGAGLVTAAVPKGILPIVAAAIPELMTEPLHENARGAISASAFDDADSQKLLERKAVLAVGPGIGKDEGTVKAILALVASSPVPIVLDADGLNAFDGKAHLLDGSKRPLVLTPHPGEMARLVGKTAQEVEADRVAIARAFAREHKIILVLKGWRTLIAAPDGKVWVNTTGNPGLAKAGSGDVLTGVIAGLIAQFPNRLIEAVRAGVYLHGLAADCALVDQTERTMLATDVIAAFPSAFRAAELSTNDSGLIWIQGQAQHL